MTGLTITAAALHEVLTRAHIAIVEHRVEQAGTMLGTLRVLFDPRRSAVAHWFPPLAAPVKTPDLAGLDTPEAEGAAATAAPPSIELPDAPGVAGSAATTASVGAGQYAAGEPRNPLPAQAAAGHSLPRRKRKGRAGTTWTAEREALLRADYPACTDRPALLARLNALPGEPIPSIKAAQVKAGVLGIHADLRTLRVIAQQAGAAGGRASVAARPAVEPTMRTPERLAALPALWMDAALPARAILDQLNELPGDRIVNTQTLYKWAAMVGLPTVRPMPEPAAPVAPAPEPAPPPDPVTPGDTKAEVMAALDAGQTVRAIAEDFGLPMSTVSNWHAEWRRANGRAAA